MTIDLMDSIREKDEIFAFITNLFIKIIKDNDYYANMNGKNLIKLNNFNEEMLDGMSDLIIEIFLDTLYIKAKIVYRPNDRKYNLYVKYSLSDNFENMILKLPEL